MASDPSFFAPHGASSEGGPWHSPYYADADEDSSSTGDAASWMWRSLQYGDTADDKKKDSAVRIDYSVLSVAVMTLGLILVVELARHKLDHVAHHKPFLKAVLEGVYEELATLGIVEFLLHVMAEYYEKYDKAKKQVFADVHFLLFYTAILNALQSLLLHYVSKRESKRLWVQTEMLELNHYVEIREEFDSVKQQLDQLHHNRSSSGNNKQKAGSGGSSSNTSHDDEADQEAGKDPKRTNGAATGPDETAEDVFALNQDCISQAFQSLVDRIRYPAVKTKYNELLLQIRFHELRVHFLQAYNLPLKLKISDYLIRSEEKVLHKLIHVSSLAWLLLTGVINLGYYVLGIVSYKVKDPAIIGEAMIWIFFWIISLFVLVSWLVKNKMKAVFRTIIKSDTLWDMNNAGDPEENGKLAAEQRKLFWGGDPKLVIAAIQTMQFGYAVALSTLIIFFEEINDGNIPMYCYFLIIFACYVVFILVTSQAIPRYTLCTSLGQLVNERQLQETLAAFYLEEAKLKEMEEQEDDDWEEMHAATEGQTVVTAVPSISSGKRTGSVGGDSSLSNSQKGDSTAALMVDMVKSSTSSLRLQLTSETLRAERQNNKKNRLKQLSDGVIAMNRMMKAKDDFDISSSSGHKEDVLGELPSVGGAKRERRVRRKAQSEGVRTMASMHADHPDAEGGPFGNGTDPRLRFDTTAVRKTEVEDDNASVGSSSSGYSDANDVPQVDHVLALKELDEHHEPKITMSERLHEYFMSRRYVVISNVFGTMFAFFFVGQRVESFLHSEGIANEKFTHFDFAHDYIFWLLTAWLGFFVIADCLLLVTFRSFSALKNNKERQRFIAGILDLLLSAGCLAVFFAAEVQRCCTPDNGSNRFLAYFNEPPACTCPMFGTRQYGGLGMIEPYISLIALRVLRFWVAKKIVLFLDSRGVWKKTDSPGILRNESLRMEAFDVFGKSVRNLGHNAHDKNHGHERGHGSHDDGHGHGHGHGHGVESGTVAEFWQEAIAKHPEVVAKHGQFSGELLRAMLGLHVEASPSTAFVRSPQVTDETRVPVPQYSERSNAKAIITQQENRLRPSTTVIEVPVSPLAAGKLERSPTATLDSLFASPTARLVRSMRRCDRMLIPFLSKWSVVDVAMTRYEMVYFDASDVDGDISLDPAGESARQAVISSKGGKGLRLCDVAVGRRVVGHLHFSEIESVHVERCLPHENSAEAIECPDVEVEKGEFWKLSSVRSLANGLRRGDEWCGIKQDRLRIHTIHGHTLYLRFYSDLEDAERHAERLAAEDEDDGVLNKNNAFQWCQTVVRFCGPSQLQQALPHFGDDTNEELRDFLIVNNGTDPLKGHHRRRSSDFGSGMFGRLKSKVVERFEI